MELKAAFAELQAKMIESKQKIKIHDIQIENLKRSSTHASLTDQEISQLPEETKVYESAGRMFLLSDIKALLGRFSLHQISCFQRCWQYRRATLQAFSLS